MALMVARSHCDAMSRTSPVHYDRRSFHCYGAAGLDQLIVLPNTDLRWSSYAITSIRSPRRVRKSVNP